MGAPVVTTSDGLAGARAARAARQVWRWRAPSSTSLRSTTSMALFAVLELLALDWADANRTGLHMNTQVLFKRMPQRTRTTEGRERRQLCNGDLRGGGRAGRSASGAPITFFFFFFADKEILTHSSCSTVRIVLLELLCVVSYSIARHHPEMGINASPSWGYCGVYKCISNS
jgi:hypothetical protein